MSLVLTRWEGESIIINNNIKVTVHQVLGKRATLVIDAPTEIPVHREEIQRRIMRETALGGQMT